MTENARDSAKGLGLKFEAYLLHTAVLALSEQLDREEYLGIWSATNSYAIKYVLTDHMPPLGVMDLRRGVHIPDDMIAIDKNQRFVPAVKNYG